MSGCKDSHNYDAQRDHFCWKHPWCTSFSILISSDRSSLSSLLFLSNGFPATSGLLLYSELVLFTSNLSYIIHLEVQSLFLFASSNVTHPSWCCSGLTFSGKPFLITPALLILLLPDFLKHFGSPSSSSSKNYLALLYVPFCVASPSVVLKMYQWSELLEEVVKNTDFWWTPVETDSVSLVQESELL